MPQARALADITIGGITAPYNRVISSDDETIKTLVDLGQATDDAKAIETALLGNPEVIELGKLPKPKASVDGDPTDQKPAADNTQAAGGKQGQESLEDLAAGKKGK